MKSWIEQQTQALRLVLARMLEKKLSTLLIMLVIGIALCLPAALYSVLSQLQSAVGASEHKPEISLYLKMDIDEASKQAIEQHLKQHAQVAEFRFVSKNTAWENMKQDSNQKDAADALSSNPLPDAFFVLPKALDANAVQAMQKEMQSWHGVDVAQLDSKWLQRLNTILHLGKNLSHLLMLLLAVALLAIIGNTIRLQFVTQRDEIQVSKLIGATHRFIRRPFLYAGAIYGFGGALLAYLLWLSVVLLFNLSINDIADLYASHFHLHLPGIGALFILIISGSGLGYLGAFAAVHRSLAQIE
jgi:cell division transport system permease protein